MIFQEEVPALPQACSHIQHLVGVAARPPASPARSRGAEMPNSKTAFSTLNTKAWEWRDATEPVGSVQTGAVSHRPS